MALLGEMYYKPRDAESWFNLPRGDDVAYAAQESWVLNGTIKVNHVLILFLKLSHFHIIFIQDNILFGKKCDEERYKKGEMRFILLRSFLLLTEIIVLKQCALERDLSLWEAGDLTEVGEKGLTLRYVAKNNK